MRCIVMLEPQEGLSYADQLAVAQHAERKGFEGVFRSDHYGSTTGTEARAATDAWTAIAGLGRETDRIRLGTLVTPATFRRVGVLAKAVATAAEMAGTTPDGVPRIELGMGTGWLEQEHRAHGLPFGDLDERYRRLTEQLEVLQGFWSRQAQPFSFDGEFVRVEEAVFRPIPEPRPRLIIGGKGPTRTPRLAARYADELNLILPTSDDIRARRETLDAACGDLDRDPGEVGLSAMLPVLVGAHREELHERARRFAELVGSEREIDELLERMGRVGVVGTPEEAADRLGRAREAGLDRVMLQDFLPDDLEMLDLVADEVVPRVAGTASA
ncbi:LLM class flavin-dependent oxidoreductase [Egibacter rhizosphaerae]|uniref:LLM class flavin-dependent oxidoreductase n=1 Tax=Egibacter rhizosphaerae TaxID=1670831 RepID=A0A411YEQ4_9ACTN|nr:LLM class flavin-dependent oxidoreductase [Egibacter rhizosphaerae]QBI19705.1 LLM class flavin-dependent oxidoreductase [Egibacter rhizosphaerae]